MLSEEHASALLVLLEAPSKQSIDAFFCSCFSERHAGAPSRSRVAAIAEGLALSKPERAAPLQQAAIALIGQVLCNNFTPEQIAALFPPDFHIGLQGLVTKVLQFHKDEWHAESLADGSVKTMPQLEGSSWQAYRKPTPGEHIGRPAVLLSLQLSAGPAGSAAAGSGSGSSAR